MGKKTGKENNSNAGSSNAGRFFYSFGTVFLLAVLTICIINFARDGRAFQDTTASAAVQTGSDSASAPEVTIKIDTSKPITPSKSSTGKQTRPAAPEKTQTDGGSTGGANQPANPGEEP